MSRILGRGGDSSASSSRDPDDGRSSTESSSCSYDIDYGIRSRYDILGLKRGATDGDIAKSFRRMALLLHPDKQPAGQSIEDAEKVRRLFFDVMEAKCFLLDEKNAEARREHDSRPGQPRAKRRSPTSPSPPPPTSARRTRSHDDLDAGLGRRRTERLYTPLTPPPKASIRRKWSYKGEVNSDDDVDDYSIISEARRKRTPPSSASRRRTWSYEIGTTNYYDGDDHPYFSEARNKFDAGLGTRRTGRLYTPPTPSPKASIRRKWSHTPPLSPPSSASRRRTRSYEIGTTNYYNGDDHPYFSEALNKLDAGLERRRTERLYTPPIPPPQASIRRKWSCKGEVISEARRILSRRRPWLRGLYTPPIPPPSLASRRRTRSYEIGTTNYYDGDDHPYFSEVRNKLDAGLGTRRTGRLYTPPTPPPSSASTRHKSSCKGEVNSDDDGDDYSLILRKRKRLSSQRNEKNSSENFFSDEWMKVRRFETRY
jgi:hypothetical protein